MATGKKAFSGTSQATLIAAIIEDEPPPISTVQPMTPPALDRVVKTCLAKDPEDRWQTAHDVELQLQWIAEGGSAGGRAGARRRPAQEPRAAGLGAASPSRATRGRAFAAGYCAGAPRTRSPGPDLDPPSREDVS